MGAISELFNFDDYADEIANIFNDINVEYIRLIGEHINDIGKLTATDLNRLEQLRRMNANIAKINDMLKKQCNLTTKQLNNLYSSIADDYYKSTAYAFAHTGKKMKDFKDNVKLMNYLRSIEKLTNNTFKNISRTTSITNDYKKLVDSAILNVSSGTTDFDSAMRKDVNSYGTGIKVESESGKRRRLDSAVRLSVLVGISMIMQGTRRITGDQFGADGYEISAHAVCAPDHIDIQGMQYSKKEFEQLNKSLKREIGTNNCKHHIFPIIIGVSAPAYTKSELAEFKRLSEEKVNINGKDYSRYECTQLMRQLENEMRKSKEKVVGYNYDTALVKAQKQRISNLQSKYRNVTNKANLTKRYDRAYVRGYSDVK